jgi:hypothetical protein
MSIPIHEIGPSFGCMYATGSFLLFMITQSFGHAYAIQSSPDANAVQEPNAHIDRHIPRRAVYARLWEEVKAS